MAPPAKEHGHPPDATALTITKGIDVSSALRIFTEMIVVKIFLSKNTLGVKKL